MISGYRMGYILVIFDLPVKKKEESREAQRFRKFLLDDGYLMLQFSVYMRPCVSVDHLEKHTERVRRRAPSTGFVKILFFTDKQWALGIDIYGTPSSFEWKNRVADAPIPPQMVFW
ncbi:MAG: CRISPR-associated endonuclease Cas2 [Bdellovibrionaceae bacterium]|nr:CRISPR-associated endonuclease Cas2 [Pseudobdellovibrionaceae bacterium]